MKNERSKSFKKYSFNVEATPLEHGSGIRLRLMRLDERYEYHFSKPLWNRWLKGHTVKPKLHSLRLGKDWEQAKPYDVITLGQEELLVLAKADFFVPGIGQELTVKGQPYEVTDVDVTLGTIKCKSKGYPADVVEWVLSGVNDAAMLAQTRAKFWPHGEHQWSVHGSLLVKPEKKSYTANFSLLYSSEKSGKSLIGMDLALKGTGQGALYVVGQDGKPGKVGDVSDQQVYDKMYGTPMKKPLVTFDTESMPIYELGSTGPHFLSSKLEAVGNGYSGHGYGFASDLVDDQADAMQGHNPCGEVPVGSSGDSLSPEVFQQMQLHQQQMQQAIIEEMQLDEDKAFLKTIDKAAEQQEQAKKLTSNKEVIEAAFKKQFKGFVGMELNEATVEKLKLDISKFQKELMQQSPFVPSSKAAMQEALTKALQNGQPPVVNVASLGTNHKDLEYALQLAQQYQTVMGTPLIVQMPDKPTPEQQQALEQLKKMMADGTLGMPVAPPLPSTPEDFWKPVKVSPLGPPSKERKPKKSFEEELEALAAKHGLSGQCDVRAALEALKAAAKKAEGEEKSVTEPSRFVDLS